MNLPNFIVIGAHKAGTTSLYHYLKAHPNVYMPELKEARYFAFDKHNHDHLKKVPSVFPITTMEGYQALFDDVSNEKAIGEASPEYFNSEFAANKIHRYIPDVKLIVSLRNPIDRAYSLFMMAYKTGRITDMQPEDYYLSEDRAQAGFYYPKLTCYFDLFGKENVKVILFDDLIHNAENCIQSLFKYLDVSDTYKPDVSRVYNQGGIPKSRAIYNLSRNKVLSKQLKRFLPESLSTSLRNLKNKNLRKVPKLDEEKRRKAICLIKDDIIQVEALLNRDLSSWYEYS